MSWVVRRIWLILSSLMLAASAFAHPANIPTARAKIDANGNVRLTLRFDMLAYVLEELPAVVADAPMNALLDGSTEVLDAALDDARERMGQELQVIGSGRAGIVDSIRFPSAAAVHAAADLSKPKLPVMMVVEVRAHLLSGSKSSAFRFPEVLGSVVLTTEFPYEEPISEPVDPGATSTSLTIPTPQQIALVEGEIRARAASEAPSRRTAPAQGQELLSSKPVAKSHAFDRSAQASVRRSKAKFAVSPTRQTNAAEPIFNPSSESATLILQPKPPWFAVLPGYVRMGFLHILPNGLDHILFVLGLFLLSRRTKDLLKQVTAFTVAHSITLALSLYGVVRLPSAIVEPIIAASIVFVAIENILTAELRKWRVGVVFLFGLVHGLGFATALQDAGLQRSDFLTALVGFNGGVELGQLSVVAAALILVGWIRSHRRYRPMVAIPASVAIALVATVWTVERLL